MILQAYVGFIRPTAHPTGRPSVIPSDRLSVCLSVCPSVRLSGCLSVCLSVCLPVFLVLERFPSDNRSQEDRLQYNRPSFDKLNDKNT